MIQNKSLRFQPDIKKSMKTLDNTIMESRRKSPINNIKGLQTHMSRIMEAKKRKIEAAQVFLLPSEKAKLAKAKL